MTGEPPENFGTAGNTASYRDWYYPAVPYRREHFNWPHCVIDGMDYVNNAWRVSQIKIKLWMFLGIRTNFIIIFFLGA